MLKRFAIVVALFSIAACGGSNNANPAAPSTSGPSIAVTITSVAGETAGTGFRYSIRLTVRETSGRTGTTLSNVEITFQRGGAAISRVTYTAAEAFVVTALAAGGSVDSRNLVVTDNEGGAYADQLTARVNTTSATAVTATASVPALLPAPPAPSAVTLVGIVTDGTTHLPIVGAIVQAISGVNNGRSGATDGNGYYSIPMLTGNVVVRFSASGGYTTVERALTLSSDFRIDLGLVKPAPPAADVEYRVSGGTLRSNLITIAGTNGATQQFGPVNLPWFYTISARTGDFLYVSAQNDLASGCITSEIYKRGVIYLTATSCGAYVIATVSGSF